MNPSTLLTESFYSAFNNSVEKDIELIENKFIEVVKHPLDYTTFQVSRKRTYQSDYDYHITIIVSGDFNNFDSINLEPGTYTTFKVFSTSKNEIKTQVRQLLKDKYIIHYKDSFRSNLFKDNYYIFVKHNKE